MLSNTKDRTESYKLLSIQGKSVIIQLSHCHMKFQNISIKLYFIHNEKHVLNSYISKQIRKKKQHLQ